MTAGGLNDPDEFHVYKYHYPDGKILAAFCPSTELSRWIGRVGIEGTICAGPDGHIYYSFGIPYDVREYSPDGRLLNRFARKIPGWKPPRIDNTSLPDSPVITLTMAILPDGKLLHSFFDKRTKPYARCLDVFDKNGDWLIGFAVDPGDPDAFGRLVRIDGQGHVYMEFWRPYPHIRKYNIAFVPVK